MKFLICGFGNVGQRHCRNLQRLIPDVEIYTYRMIGENRVVSDARESRHINLPLFEVFGIKKEYKDLDEALVGNKYDGVLICTPADLHTSIALKVSKYGYNLFIEKPLTVNNDEDIDELYNLVSDKNLVVVMGYQMRFHPCILELKRMLEEEITNIFSIYVEHTSYMPGWIKGIDYKELYASKESLGGGVILSQIHEIDYLNFLFNDAIDFVYGEKAKISSLETNVEDTAISVFEAFKENNRIPIIVNLNFAQESGNRRIIRILTEKGSIQVDLNLNTITINGKIIFKRKIDWNSLFRSEMINFLKCIKNNKIEYPTASLEDGMESFYMAKQWRNNL